MIYRPLTTLARKKLLKESIETADLEQLGNAIREFDELFQNTLGNSPQETLPEIYKGIQAANQRFDEYITQTTAKSIGGFIRGVFSAIDPANVDTPEVAEKRKLAEIVTDMFTYVASLVQAFKVIPTVLTRWVPSAAEKDKNKTLNMILNTDTTQKQPSLLKKAMSGANKMMGAGKKVARPPTQKTSLSQASEGQNSQEPLEEVNDEYSMTGEDEELSDTPPEIPIDEPIEDSHPDEIEQPQAVQPGVGMQKKRDNASLKKSIVGAFYKALIPAAGLAKKVPYGINAKRAAIELLNLTPNQLYQLANQASNMTVPVTAKDIQQLTTATKQLDDTSPTAEKADAAEKAATPEMPADISTSVKPSVRASDVPTPAPGDFIPITSKEILQTVEKKLKKGMMTNDRGKEVPVWKAGFTDEETRKDLVKAIVDLLVSKKYPVNKRQNSGLARNGQMIHESFDLTKQKLVKNVLKEAGLYEILDEIANEVGLSLTEVIILLRDHA